jgi:DNA modification methylase
LGKIGVFLWIFAKKRAFFIKNGLFWAKNAPEQSGAFFNNLSDFLSP